MNNQYLTDQYISAFLEAYQNIGIISPEVSIYDIPMNKYTFDGINSLISKYAKNIIKFYGQEDFLSRSFSTESENLSSCYDFILMEISNTESSIEIDVNSIKTHYFKHFPNQIEFTSQGVNYAVKLLIEENADYENIFYLNIQKTLDAINNIIKNNDPKLKFFYVIQIDGDTCALIRCTEEQMSYLQNNKFILLHSSFIYD